MNFTSVLINVCLSIILFFANSVIGKMLYGYKDLFKYGKFGFYNNDNQSFEGNFFLTIINPTVFTALFAVILQQTPFSFIIETLWQMVIFYWLTRLLYYFIKNYLVFINIGYECFSFVLSVFLCESVFFVIILPLYKQNQSIGIPITELRNAIWYAIIAYVATTIWKIMKSYFIEYNIYPIEKRRKIIRTRYDKFSKKYGKTITNTTNNILKPSVSNPDKCRFNALVYSIMIFEDYNRPYIIRLIEKIAFVIIKRKQMTLGIMQVTVSRLISDQESIQIAIQKLIPFFELDEAFEMSDENIYKALDAYNQGPIYGLEVTSIYNELSYIVSIDDFINDYEPV